MYIGPNERELKEQRIAQRVATLSAQIHALTTELIDAVAEVDSVDLSYGSGARSIGHWLSIVGAWTLPEAHRMVRVAHQREQLGPIYEMAVRGEVPVPVLDSVAKVITPENTKSIQNIVATCTPSQTQRVLSKYRELRPEPTDGTEGDDASPPPEPDYWWRNWIDDKGRGRFDAALSPLASELLEEAYAAAAKSILKEQEATARAAANANDSAESGSESPDLGSGSPDPDAATDRPSPGRWYPPRTGTAADEAGRRLAELTLADARRNGVRRTGGEPFSVLVTVDLETLLEALGLNPTDGPFRLGSQCFTRSGRRLSPTELAEVLKSSTVQTVVTADGVPIWMGQEARFPTRHQRRLLNLRGNGTCEVPGCTNTVGLDGHHVIYYESGGGPTSMCNLLHVCGPHHRQLHAEHWRITSEPGSQKFTIRTASGRCLGCTHPDGPPSDLSQLAKEHPAAHSPPDLALAPDATRKHGGGAPLTHYALDVFISGLLAA